MTHARCGVSMQRIPDLAAALILPRTQDALVNIHGWQSLRELQRFLFH
jgi:hypothetical protein